MICKICNGKMRIWFKKMYDDRHGYPGYFRIFKCSSCGFGQTDPQIGKVAIKKLYEHFYPRKYINIDNIILARYRKPSSAVLWRKGLTTGCHFLVKERSLVLDIGSGVGYSLLYLKNMKCMPYGIDPDINGKRVARKFKIPFHHGFIDDGPFKGKLFDYITASQVIEHTNDPVRFLKMCKPYLKPGGKMILSFPNSDSLSRKIFGKNWLHWHIPYHLNHFNKKSLQMMVSKSGMKIMQLKTTTPNMWTNLQIRRLLNKPNLGKRDTFWDGTGETNKKLSTGYLPKIIRFLEENNYMNRIIDVLGMGESFVVTLETS